ncbi:MAG: hypothetical protein R3D84_15770 [Paracoccaceae bacterium]
MTKPDDTIRILIPLQARKKNRRPKIVPPAEHRERGASTGSTYPARHRPRMELASSYGGGEFVKIQELAEAVGLAERHVSRQLRLAYLAPEVLKRLTCGREASALRLYDLGFLAGETWQEQAERTFR